MNGAPLPCTTPRPSADKWFRIYMGVSFVFLILLAIFCFAVPFIPFPDMTADDKMMAKIMGPTYGVAMIISMGIFGVSLFTKPKPWTWVYNLVVICLGLTSCSMIFCIPLLIFWLKPECKNYYGRPA
ncbi:MAG: hypothetical protein ACKVJU_16965 [Verrucomicrobiales bacterium]